MKEYRLTDWLPTTKKEVELRGWDELDVILSAVTPTWITLLWSRRHRPHPRSRRIARSHHPQPNWRDDLRDFKNWDVPSVLRHQSRLYGFDGQQIYCQQTLAQ